MVDGLDRLQAELERQNDLREQEILTQKELAIAEFKKAQAIEAQIKEAKLARESTDSHTEQIRLLIERVQTLLDVTSVVISDDRIGNIHQLLQSILPVIMRASGSQEEIARLERLLARTGTISVTGSVQGDVAGAMSKGEAWQR